MTKSFQVNITQEIINSASVADSSKCMIAQALRMRGCSSTNVTAESATFNFGDTRYTFPLPASAAVELMKFDQGKDGVKPFTFVLNGKTGFTRPINRNPPQAKRGPTKKRGPNAAKRCKRRFHGLRVIEVDSKQEIK